MDNRKALPNRLQEGHLAPLNPKLRIDLEIQAIVITANLPSSSFMLTFSQLRKLGTLLQSLQHRQVNL